MKRPLLRCLPSLLLGIFLTTFINFILYNNEKQSFTSCQDDWEKIYEMLEKYSQPWVKNENKHKEIRTELSLKCNGLENAIILHKNSSSGRNITFDAEKKNNVKVSSEYSQTFVKKHPVFHKMLQSCAVVGNGGILANSKCGKMIDSNDFVIRCNMAPLVNGYEEHVGVKTDIVTANPRILATRYGSLLRRRRRFAESLVQYGNAMLLLPAFSSSENTKLSFRVFYTTEDFKLPIQSAFMNPKYLESLAVFWGSHGLLEKCHSSGFMMVSLALELCDNVHLFGFWPFSVHPDSFQNLTYHYYDDMKARKKIHVMSDEFSFLLQLHNQGVLKLHLRKCGPD